MWTTEAEKQQHRVEEAKNTTEWTKAWKILVAALKELGVPDVDDTAKVILDRLSKENMVVTHRVSGSQDGYRNLVWDLGSQEVAAEHIAARLRELSDIVESPGYPAVLGWTDEGHPLPIASVALTLSFPWGG